MSEDQLILAGLGLLVAMMGWSFRDNHTAHKDIYDKLHSDHESLSEKLQDVYEKLGGKQDK